MLCCRSDASDVSIWQDMHDLVFGRRRGEVTGANRFICPTFFNSTESLRSVCLSLLVTCYQLSHLSSMVEWTSVSSLAFLLN